MADKQNGFLAEANRILSLKVVHRVNRLGGYGPASEVIYNAHPSGCPSVIVDNILNATATFMSNGSVGFTVKLKDGMDVKVLDSHFDPVEKREVGVPSTNLWLRLNRGKELKIVSLMNPAINFGCIPISTKIVKVGDPERAMWYCSAFKIFNSTFETAVKLSLVYTSKGPAIVRSAAIFNRGSTKINGQLWSYSSLHGTQKFVYNKEIWYDCGAPVTEKDIIMTARVPYSEIVQIKRLHSEYNNLTHIASTSDYSTFVGDTSISVLLPASVLKGEMVKGGAGTRINRFATAAIGASGFSFSLAPKKSADLQQYLLYIDNNAINEKYRMEAGHTEPTFSAMEKSFRKATGSLLKVTNINSEVYNIKAAKKDKAENYFPPFELQLPAEKAVSEYANSVWTGVKELYENCRAHGAKLADGIELGTRDRGQDMWPKMKEDPGRVRDDLVYALGFTYQTTDSFPKKDERPLTLKEKLHGMFPRQYPSSWNNRTIEIKNDNRPYTDSPLWLLNSLCMYIKETGDTDILFESVGTIKLTNPEKPEVSGIIGGERVLPIVKVIEEVLLCFKRHADDSPYGMAQILYGDWCDPIDMFGTSVVGDASTRGKGRGVQTRLSAHLFLTIVEVVDVLESRHIADSLRNNSLFVDLSVLKNFAAALRTNIIKWAYEDGPDSFNSGFLNCIHEFHLDGSVPNYKNGETGYTLGSLKNRDFDSINRRELNCQAYCIEMINTKRDWLPEVNNGGEIISKVLRTTDKLFFDEKLGLVMFTKPIANNQRSIELAGRMGVLPVGTAENGEYHHCQVMMHRYRLSIAGEVDTVWKQFKPMMSALRDESLCGPFETPSTSYVSDRDDPHYGKGMYFGLSGSVDWIVEIFQKIAGVSLNLHDPDKPDIEIAPILPSELKKEMVFKRIIHRKNSKGLYDKIALTVTVAPKRGKESGDNQTEIFSLEGKERVEIKLFV